MNIILNPEHRGSGYSKTPGLLLRIVCLVAVLSITVANAGNKELPRKLGPFELEVEYNNVKKELSLFKCHDRTPAAKECRLIGYPERDDFITVKFYKNKIVSVAEFRYNVDWDKTIEQTREILGKSTSPEYKSNKATALIWQDGKTHITLTNLPKPGYVVYEIRDRKMEPLYRRSVTAAHRR